jgi:hypothetical protein
MAANANDFCSAASRLRSAASRARSAASLPAEPEAVPVLIPKYAPISVAIGALTALITAAAVDPDELNTKMAAMLSATRAATPTITAHNAWLIRILLPPAPWTEKFPALGTGDSSVFWRPGPGPSGCGATSDMGIPFSADADRRLSLDLVPKPSGNAMFRTAHAGQSSRCHHSSAK